MVMQRLASPTCVTCGAPRGGDGSHCSACEAQDSGERPGPQLSRSVQEATTAWGKRTFGGPRTLAELIENVDVRDEVIERVATEIVRREIQIVRGQPTRVPITPPRIDPGRIDPFAVSPEALRGMSEHVAACTTCGSSGTCRCVGCAGSGSTKCPTCGGSGRELRHYKTVPSKYVNCKTCRTRGSVVCTACIGSGSVTCGTCSGAGGVVEWLEYAQISRWTVTIEPDSPVIGAHPQLRTAGFLDAGRLESFSVLSALHADGPVTLGGYRGGNSPALRAVANSLDPRLERVSNQQYLSLAVVRRDVTYSMCGTRGTLVLSGKDLAPSHTKAATNPIRRRLTAGSLVLGALALGSHAMIHRFGGSTAYFRSVNATLGTLGAALLILLVSPVFGALRAVRPGWAFAKIHTSEKVLAGLSALVLAAIVVVGVVEQPKLEELSRSLAEGHVARARVVLDGVKEKQAPSKELAEAEDSVLLAEAKGLTGDAQLNVLDRVASRRGARAREAAAWGREMRLIELRRLNDAKSPELALNAVNRWFSDTWSSDAEVAEERARAFDVSASACADPLCRLTASSSAEQSRTSASRTQRRGEARAALFANLTVDDRPNEPALVRLKRMREVAALAERSAKLEDKELVEHARKVAALAESVRTRTVLMGADEATISELLGTATVVEGKNTYLVLGGMRVYLTLDGQRRCRGFYLTGATKESRSIAEGPSGAGRVLSQVVGHPAEVKRAPASSPSVSRWYEHPAAIVARWNGAQLIELRIGDATP